MIEPSIAEHFRPYLGPGERIVWTGAPPRGLRLHPRDAFLVPFSIVWLGFVVFWEAQVVRQGGPPFFLLWGAMFLVVGLFFMVGRFFIDIWARSRTLYAVSDRRALLLRRVFSEKLIAAPFGPCVVVRKSDGSGTLTMGPKLGAFSFFGRAAQRGNLSVWVPALTDDVEFVGVPDVIAVSRLVNPGQSSPLS